MLGIAFGTTNQISQEFTVKKYGHKVHVFLKFLLSMLLTYIVNVIYKLFTIGSNDLIKVLFDFKFIFNIESIWLLVAFLASTIITAVLVNKLLKTSAIYILGIITKLSMVIVLGTEIILGNLDFSVEVMLAIIIFIVGLLLVLNLTKIKQVKNINKTAFFSLLIIVIFGVVHPYSQQTILNMELINKETLLIISSLTTSMYGLFFLKPDMAKVKKAIKPYLIQSSAHVISTFALMAIIESSMTTYVFALGAMGVVTTVFSAIVLKTKINKLQYLGVVLSMIGFVYMQTLLNG
jgi:drug/metabolite transporter (DMT)-like permease